MPSPRLSADSCGGRKGGRVVTSSSGPSKMFHLPSPLGIGPGGATDCSHGWSHAFAPRTHRETRGEPTPRAPSSSIAAPEGRRKPCLTSPPFIAPNVHRQARPAPGIGPGGATDCSHGRSHAFAPRTHRGTRGEPTPRAPFVFNSRPGGAAEALPHSPSFIAPNVHRQARPAPRHWPRRGHGL